MDWPKMGELNRGSRKLMLSCSLLVMKAFRTLTLTSDEGKPKQIKMNLRFLVNCDKEKVPPTTVR